MSELQIHLNSEEFLLARLPVLVMFNPSGHAGLPRLNCVASCLSICVSRGRKMNLSGVRCESLVAAGQYSHHQPFLLPP